MVLGQRSALYPTVECPRSQEASAGRSRCPRESCDLETSRRRDDTPSPSAVPRESRRALRATRRTLTDLLRPQLARREAGRSVPLTRSVAACSCGDVALSSPWESFGRKVRFSLRHTLRVWHLSPPDGRCGQQRSFEVAVADQAWRHRLLGRLSNRQGVLSTRNR